MTIYELYNLKSPDYFFNPYSNEVYDVKRNEIRPITVSEFDELVRADNSELVIGERIEDELPALQINTTTNVDLVSGYSLESSVLEFQGRSESVPEPSLLLLLSLGAFFAGKRMRK